MPTQELVFGHFLQHRRKELELTPHELAIKIGYRNTTKGIRRIAAVERGEISKDIVDKLMAALNITEDERLQCSKKEQIYIDKLVSKMPQFKPVISYRAMACIYVPVAIPDYIQDRNSMTTFAINFAKEHHAYCCLQLNYNLRYYIDRMGIMSSADKSLKEIPTSSPDIGKLL